MQQDPARVYSLSFAPAKRGRKPRPPEIVIRVAREYVAELEGHLRNPLLYSLVQAEQYLGEYELFRFPDQPHLPGLDDGTRKCGFRDCAYLVETDDGREYHLPLGRELLGELVLTLKAILVAHNQGLLEDQNPGSGTNRSQLVSLDTICNVKGGFYAHGAHGHVFPGMRRWLYGIAKENKAPPGFLTSAKPLPDSIHDAIWQAWRAVSEPSEFTRLEKDDCFGVISPDGRFSLNCPGNACDLSIYPDHDSGPDPTRPGGFGCHNLDAASQQLALVAGLAALCDLASEELG